MSFQYIFVSGVFLRGVQRLAAFPTGHTANVCTNVLQCFLPNLNNGACTEENIDANPFPHCSFLSSLQKVFTMMMMGEIENEMRYSTLPVAQLLYIAFSFLVIILLSNVLIAIVTDSYGVIENERAAMVFWSNRLDFAAKN